MAPTTFTQVYNNLRPGLFESGQHVRGDEKNGYREYYTHNPLVPSGRGSEALERRRDKYARGAAIVVDALNNEYPSAVVKRVINAVSKRTGRDLYKEVTRGDLELLRKELDRPKFSDILANFAPVLDEKPDEPVRGKIRKDTKQVYLHYQGLLDAWLPEDQEWRDKRHRDGATLVKQAIITQYGKQVANEALAVVSRHVGHDLGKKTTLADLKHLEQELPRQQQIYERLGQALAASAEGDAKDDVTALYNAITAPDPNDCSPKVMFERFASLKEMVGGEWPEKFVTEIKPLDSRGRWAFAFKIGDAEIYRSDRLKDGIEFALPPAVLENDDVLGHVLDIRKEGRDASPSVMFKHFEELRAAADEDLKAQLESVVELPDGKGRWAYAFKVGGIEIYRSAWLQNGPGQHRLEFALAQASANETTEQIEDDMADTWRSRAQDTVSVQWPNSDATVVLRDQIYRDYIERGLMQFDERAGTLKLDLASSHVLDPMLDAAVSNEDRDRILAEYIEGKKTSLTDFIRGNFGVGPDRQDEFRNIAHNILGYVHQGGAGPVSVRMLEVANGGPMGDANNDSGTVQMKFTLSMTQEGNVGVDGETRLRYKNSSADDDVVPGVDYSKYTFVRREHFEISPDNLGSGDFDPKANLRAVRRHDTIEFEGERLNSLERRHPEAALPAAPQRAVQ